MTIQPEQHPSGPQTPTLWQPEAIEAFTKLCQMEGLNPVRSRKLVDNYVATQRKPSRQELIDALKQRPRIQNRATILSSITKTLNTFLETFMRDA
jgi:type I restriction enzyme R subunit